MDTLADGDGNREIEQHTNYLGRAIAGGKIGAHSGAFTNSAPLIAFGNHGVQVVACV